MPSPTRIPGDEKQDSNLDVGQRHADELTSRLSSAEQQPGTADMSDFENNYDKNADSAQEDANIDKLRQRESQGSNGAGWKTDVDGSKGRGSSRTQSLIQGVVKHRKGLAIGGGATGGIVAIMMFFSSMLGLPGLGNMIMSDDPGTRAIQARMLKAFGGTTGDDAGCEGTKVKTFGCKTKRISHAALASLEKANITAYDSAGNKIEAQKKGYPERNPASYKVEVRGTVHDVPGPQLAKFISDNNVVKGRVFGTGGIFNPGYKNWASKYLTERVLKPGGIEKKGGLADGENKKQTANERAAAFREKLASVIPGFDTASGGKATLAERLGEKTKLKVEKQLNGAKKGGVGYLASVSTCVGVKLPMYFAAGFAAVQIAQILPVINEVILSPSSKAMANGGDAAVGFTAEDTDFIMSTLTEKYPDENGNMASALDSPILQSALNVNTGKPAISEEFAPGYAAITAPIVVGSIAANAAMAPFCNSVMSPASMYSAMAVDAAATIAASTTVVGGVVKVLGSWLLSEVAVKAATALTGAAASWIITELATNEDIPAAKGKKLGDLLGTSAYLLKESAGAARGLNVLTEAQLPAANVESAKLDAEMRDMDVAALSPFDTSSKYTFLGSITSNFNLSLIANSGYGSNVLGRVVALAKLPFVTSAGAAPVHSYAEEFNLSTGDGTSPCITVAGSPCHGLTSQQISMGVGEASSALYNEGWIDDSKEITDDSATIMDLVDGGQIKADTPLYDHITTCGDLLSGDYLINAASCTAVTTAKSTSGLNSGLEGACLDEEKESCSTGATVEGVKDAKSLAAMAPALLDYQIAQSFNGNDEVETESATETAGATIDRDKLYEDSTGVGCAQGTDFVRDDDGYFEGNLIRVKLCSIPNTSEGGQPMLINSRASGAVLALINQMRIDTNVQTIKIASTFRTMVQQQHAWDCNNGNPKGEDCSDIAGRAAKPGTSNHQMGYAIDFELPGGNSGATKPGNLYWDWLSTNASKYGFSSNVGESWHWSVTGG